MIMFFSGLVPHFASVAYMADGNSLRKPLGSGLFLAAKYNIMAAEFIPYVTYMGSDALADKGVMMLKVGTLFFIVTLRYITSLRS